MTNAITIRRDGTTERITLPSENAHEIIHEAVGGWFDCVRLPDHGIVMYVHDEGIIAGMEPNVMACILAKGLICGDAVLVGLYDEDGNADGEDYDVPADFLTDEFSSAVALANTSESTIADLRTIRDESDWTPTVTSF